jgi:hypothetical protein
MMRDALATFCTALALPTSGTGYFNVGDVIPLTNIRDIGRGKPPIYLVVLVNVAVTSGSTATVQFILASDSVNPPRTDGTSENLHFISPAISKGTLVAGYFAVRGMVPLEPPVYAANLGLQVNIGTTALTAGSITAFLTADPYAWKAFPAAVNS